MQPQNKGQPQGVAPTNELHHIIGKTIIKMALFYFGYTLMIFSDNKAEGCFVSTDKTPKMTDICQLFE